MFNFIVERQCSRTKARIATFTLPHATLKTPIFMPVGTQGTIKGLTPEQISKIGYRMILGNTYHLEHKPGSQLLDSFGGLHQFMNWPNGLLTDSGGFQMVSLSKLMKLSEEGVEFSYPHDENTKLMLTPERSIQIQNRIGADIIMQLDDVVHSETTGYRVEEAMNRSIRWLDRCIEAHSKPDEQSLFPIVQGGLDAKFRAISAKEVCKRNTHGYAIGGLSGGEDKLATCEMISISTDILPRNKPRYAMGIGYAIDLVVFVGLGCDMFDCVYPTRTARFGTALIDSEHPLNLNKLTFANDHSKIDDSCHCSTCESLSRAQLHHILKNGSNGPQLLTIHNLYYQYSLMNRIREAIECDQYPEFVEKFSSKYFAGSKIPEWVQYPFKKS
ncbi:hypothetical protein GJ496_000283 [Pomphorhynchus laevis]|nr:hypothetical protein GJ496_000283 [Pomphorhynchus laevis]